MAPIVKKQPLNQIKCETAHKIVELKTYFTILFKSEYLLNITKYCPTNQPGQYTHIHYKQTIMLPPKHFTNKFMIAWVCVHTCDWLHRVVPHWWTLEEKVFLYIWEIKACLFLDLYCVSWIITHREQILAEGKKNNNN